VKRSALKQRSHSRQRLRVFLDSLRRCQVRHSISCSFFFFIGKSSADFMNTFSLQSSCSALDRERDRAAKSAPCSHTLLTLVVTKRVSFFLLIFFKIFPQIKVCGEKESDFLSTHTILAENFSELLKLIVTLTDKETQCVMTASILVLQDDFNPSDSWPSKILKRDMTMTQTKRVKGTMSLMRNITSFRGRIIFKEFNVKFL
jgi:hypothetical protein